MWFVEPKLEFLYLAIILSIFSIFFSEISFVFYNSLMVFNFREESLGKVSGIGWGFGYFGAIISLILVLYFLILPEEKIFDLDKSMYEHVRITMPLASIWLLVFSLPIMIFFSNPKPIKKKNNFIKDFIDTITIAKQVPNLLKFLFARMLYNDGLITLFAFGGIFAAKVFYFTQTEILIFAIILNITSGLGAFIGGFLNNRSNSIIIIKISLILIIIIGLICIFTTNKTVFWIFASFIGFFVGPCQSASRVWISHIIPKKSRTSIFGFYTMSGKITSFIGPLLYGWIILLSGTEKYGMFSVIILIGLGYLFLQTIND